MTTETQTETQTITDTVIVSPVWTTPDFDFIPWSMIETPDLHLKFDWEWAEKEQKDICLLTTYTYSEANKTPEVRQSVNYYLGLESKPRIGKQVFGKGKGRRLIDMDDDYSTLTPEQTKAVLQTPQPLIQEIHDKVASKEDPDDTVILDEEHFQTHGRDTRISGVDPIAYSRENDVVNNHQDLKQRKVGGKLRSGSKGWVGDEEEAGIGPVPTTKREEYFSGLNSTNPGARVFKNRVDAPRKDSPWWMLDNEKFQHFARILSDERYDDGCFHKTLDQAILYEFFILGFEDRDTFEEHKEEFLKEDTRQRRGIKSVDAVKKRRQRLVKKGNELFGPAPNVIPISRPRVKQVKRAFTGLMGR